MDKQFDQLSKSLAEGVSRREALRKFGIGLAGALLAAVGLSSKAAADPNNKCWFCLEKHIAGYYVCSPTKPVVYGFTCKPTTCQNCGGASCC